MQTYHLFQEQNNKPTALVETVSPSIADQQHQAAGIFDHHHHQQLQQQQQQNYSAASRNTITTMPTINTTSNSPANQATINCQASMASFVARLMSLSAHELHSLHADHELMRHLTETQLLMESRLQQTKLTGMIQQQQLAIQHQMQFQQQQQQIQLANQQNSPNYQLTQTPIDCNQMSQLQFDHYYAQALSLAASQQYNAAAVAASSNSNNNNSTNQQHLLMAAQQTSQLQLALDLRTSQQVGYHLQTNLGSPAQRLYSSAGSYYGSSASSTSSAGSSPVEQVTQTQSKHNQAQQAQQQQQQKQPQQAQKRSVNPKKIKLAQYERQVNSSGGNIKPGLAVLTPLPASNRAEPAPKRACNSTRPAPAASIGSGKKYKGEFDEPSPIEVEQRQRNLARPDTNYHGPSASQCACVLGSIFHNKTNAEMLATIERWRRLPTEERIRTKWDVTDLPKDIPLSEIKKFEDLRRDASNGRADFGGASKRKPLGIRGTRQFLLILYCLWGHPGREDPMQKEGYCPHCFAKIKKANEQSTLVRVVNHFNMKHRRGANPRLSPRRDTLASAAASPQAVSAIANELPSPPTRPLSPIANQLKASPKNDDEPSTQLNISNRSSSTHSTSSSISTSTASSPATSFSPPPTPSTTDSSTKLTCKPEPETSEMTPTTTTTTTTTTIKSEQSSEQVAIKLKAKTH